MKKVGLFGGTFSPPHVGHRRALEIFVREEGLSQVLVMPTFIPPHKVRSDMTGTEDRLAMCRLAFESVPGVVVSDLEIERGGKSYTALTLQELQREGERLVFLCGTDMFLTLDEWYRPDLIFSMADIVCMPRNGDADGVAELEKKREEYRRKFHATTRILPYSPLEISSSAIRIGIGNGDPSVREWVAPAVWNYILEKGLYASEGLQQ